MWVASVCLRCVTLETKTHHELQDVRALDILVSNDVRANDLDAARAATVTTGHLAVCMTFMKDEHLRKHLPRMFSLIKNESWGLEDD